MVTDLAPGDRFPSQTELMRRFKVSDRTVLRSLDDLRHAGWIVRRHGSGTFVADPGQRAPVLHPSATKSTTLAAVALTFGPFYQYCVELLSVQPQIAGMALVCHHARHEASFEDVLTLEAMNPFGFLLFNYHLVPIAKRLLERGHRTVIMGAPPADVYPEAPCVYADHDIGGWIACRHLLDWGHHRIAYVCTNARYPLESTMRWKGHSRAIAEAKAAGVSAMTTVHGAEEVALWCDDPSAMAAYFRRPGAPTAVAAWNDAEAVRFVRLLHNAGLTVPDDVSIIGFDRLPVSEDCIPPLTTVDQHVDCQLRTVLDLLVRPSAPPANQSIVVVPTLVSRASCAAPRAG